MLFPNIDPTVAAHGKWLLLEDNAPGAATNEVTVSELSDGKLVRDYGWRKISVDQFVNGFRTLCEEYFRQQQQPQ